MTEYKTPVAEALRRERDAALAELDRLHSWSGLMELLDEHWPATIFPGPADAADARGDDGPRILALIRAVDVERSSRQAWADKALSDEQAHRELLGSIWLYVDWRYVTKQLTTEQKNLWADAVDTDYPEPKAERWWDRRCTCGHGPDRHEVISETPGCRDCKCMWFLQEQPDSGTFCACVSDEQASQLGSGFARPVCAVHPAGGAA
jgi:hypothetical protein